MERAVDRLRSDNIQFVVESAGEEAIRCAQEKMATAVKALAWRTLRRGQQPPPLYVEVCAVAAENIMTGSLQLIASKSHFRSDILCGLPAYYVYTLEKMGFCTVCVRDANRCVLWVSAVPMFDP
jgi:hypothetical protein